ncbi:hypothetical protein BVRB_4g090630 [Beta vulgaris subsp. vulgaris]|nr:hypothetical protein BVRB_4g090630 [Beta vulgaris subsp. vulgaris]
MVLLPIQIRGFQDSFCSSDKFCSTNQMILHGIWKYACSSKYPIEHRRRPL